MTVLDQIYAVLIYAWSEITNKAPAMGFLIATTVSSLRMITEGQFKVAEALLCGILASIVMGGGDYLQGVFLAITGLNIPTEVVTGIAAGAIGYAGSKPTMLFLKNRFIKEKGSETNE